jgi:hypothetical protein
VIYKKMPGSGPSPTEFYVLLDHDNIPYSKLNPRALLEHWLSRLPEGVVPGALSLHVRAYGGWYSGNVASVARTRATEFYQDELPTVFEYGGKYCRVIFEFADSIVGIGLANARSRVPSITHTVATRTADRSVRPKIGAPVCAETGCGLKDVRTWIRKQKACLRPACPNQFKDQFERREQRQVDVHMAIDLAVLALALNEPSQVAVATDDSDLLPALSTAALRRQRGVGLTLLRFATSQAYLDDFLVREGVLISQVR